MRSVYYQLKNKLQLVLIEDKNSPSATVMVLVKTGSRFEPVRYAGVAHFVEHVFFKGTTSMPTSKDIGMAIEIMGGSSNAFTSYDYTGYYIKVPADKLDKAIGIMADMIKNSLFSEKEIEKERGVIVEEIRMYEDIPRVKVNQLFNGALFKGDPLGRDIAGSQESVNRIRRKHFIEFIDSYYTGKNILVSVAGSFRKQKVKEQLQTEFSTLKLGKQGRFRKSKSRELGRKVAHSIKRLEQTHIVMGGYGYKRNLETRFALQVGNSLLSAGFGSRLFQIIRDKLGLAYYVNSSIYSFDEVGKFTVAMGVKTKKSELAINAVFKELVGLAKGDFSNEEFERAKSLLVGALVTGLEATDDVAGWYGLQLLLRDEPLTVEMTIKKIKAVTKDEVVKVWRDILHPDNMLIAALGPTKIRKEKIGFELLT